jgi:hypothetical protein
MSSRQQTDTRSFRVVSKGYARKVVDRRLIELGAELVKARRRAEDAEAALAALAAQAAAVSTLEKELAGLAGHLRQQADAEADTIVTGATRQARKKLRAAERLAGQMVGSAGTRVEGLRAEAARCHTEGRHAAEELRLCAAEESRRLLAAAGDKAGEIWSLTELDLAESEAELARLTSLCRDLRGWLVRAAGKLDEATELIERRFPPEDEDADATGRI